MSTDSFRLSDSSRRTFLKNSALGVTAVAGTLGMMRSVHAGNDETIRVGLVGCGARGLGAASEILNADKNVKLVAMADAFSDLLEQGLTVLQKNEAHASQIDVPNEKKFVGFDAYQQLIDSGVDVVLLCTPPHFRPQHLAAAVKAKKHIFVEKPVAVDAPGVRSVLASAAEAKKNNLSLVSGLCFRYNPICMETVKRIHNGQIGDIVTMNANRNGSGGARVFERKPEWTDMEYQMRNWYYYKWISGDFNVEQFVHSLDIVAWVLKDEYPVVAFGLGGREVRNAKQYGNIYDHMAVCYEYADGKRLYSYTRHMLGCWNENETYAIGTKGQAKVMHGVINSGKEKWFYKGAKKSMWQEEQIAFVKSIREDKPLNHGDYMSKSTLMAIMGREACYTGQQIKWDEAMNSSQDLTPAKYEWGSAPEVVIAKPGMTKFS